MEQKTNEQGQIRKIYPMNSIWAGTFLGGPLTAGYLIAENFKTLGQNDKIKPTWAVAIIATVIIFVGIFMIPNVDKIPRQIIPLIYTAIAYYIVNETQSEKIKEYISRTGQTFSVWRSLGVGLIWAIVTSIPIFVIAYFSYPTGDLTTKSYGRLKHEIYFQKDNITASEVDRIADALTKAILFDEEQQKGIFLEKNNNKYIISFPLINNSWTDPVLVADFENLRIKTQTFLSDGIVVFNLCDDDITQIKKVLD